MTVLLLLQQASKYRTLESLTEFYMEHLPLLYEYTIINSTEGDNCIDLYVPFSDISKIENQLYTPFANGKVSIVNENIVRRGLLTGDGKAGMQGYVSFDTQVISYFYRYYKTRKNSLPKNIQDVLNLLYRKQIGVEYYAYTIENLFFSTRNVSEVKDSICAFERLYYKNKMPKILCLMRANRVIKSYDKMRKNEGLRTIRVYHLIYATLLQMCCIQLENKSCSLSKKMHKLCDFMANEMCTMMQPELILAKRYFEQGQRCTFFGKIQRKNTNIIADIKNMAWDLFHLRMLEMGSTIKMNRKADVNIPYFCTYDQRLLDIKDCYELCSLAINYVTGEKVPFYSKTIEIVEYLEKYGTEEQFVYRVNKCYDVDIKEIIERLEKEIVLKAVDDC